MPPRDREACQKIMAAIRAAGSRVQVPKVAFVPQEKALEVEAFWIRMLVRGAVDLVNHQIDEVMRQRAIESHLAICRQAGPKGKNKGVAYPGQGDLFDQSLPPSSPLSRSPPMLSMNLPPPEDIDVRPARKGRPWADTDVRQLTAHSLAGEPVERLAARLGRTPPAILAKLAVVASRRQNVKQRMLEIGLRRSGWMQPLPRGEVVTSMRPPYPPASWPDDTRLRDK